MKNNTTLVYVLCDGIKNSVFTSQVFEPIRTRIAAGTITHAHIISCETTPVGLESYIAAYKSDSISIHIAPRARILFLRNLNQCIQRIQQTIIVLNNKHTLMARGMWAAHICNNLRNAHTAEYIIQARGLHGAESSYKAQYKPYLARWLHRARAAHLSYLEKIVYRRAVSNGARIESVSPALQEYLVTHMRIAPKSIFIAQHDIIPIIHSAERMRWRTKIRAELNINDTTHVYCYSGSHKPWQCIRETIEYFSNLPQLENSMLLILTPHNDECAQILCAYPQHISQRIIVRSIAPMEVMHYLCAGDSGILFREPHLMNWISRPTKLLEYRSAGLQVIHNNTVAFANTEQ